MGEYIDVSVSLNLVEEMFRKSRQTREYDVVSTLILELKISIESYLGNRLQRGHAVSIQQAFNHCCSELVSDEEDWMLD